MGVLNGVLMGKILLFLGKFEERLILLGFEGIFEWYEVIFCDIEIAKNIDFSRFCRTRYRTQNGGQGMKRSDMPFLASGGLS